MALKIRAMSQRMMIRHPQNRRRARQRKKPTEPFRIKHPWPAGYWGGPNVLLRTSLFPQPSQRPVSMGQATWHRYNTRTLRPRGPRLNQWDLDVFMCVLDTCRNGKTLDMTARQFLRSMLRGESSRDVESLKASCRRLHELLHRGITSIQHHEGQAALGRQSAGDLRMHRCEKRAPASPENASATSLDPGLWWFIRDDYTQFDIKDRKTLRQHRLAAGLFAMYHTHATDSSYPLDRLRDLLGVVARGKEFERLLRAALGFLREHKLVEAWQISDGHLSVTPKMTAAKIAYLNRKGLPVAALAKQAGTTQRPGTAPKAEAPKMPTASFSTPENRFGAEFIRSVGAWLDRIADQVRARRQPSPLC